MKCHVDAIQWGGVVAEIFRDLQKPMRFCEGGVVAEFFRDLQKPMRFSGGGIVAEMFRGLQKPTRFGGGGGGSSAELFFSVTSKQKFPLMGPFFSILLSRRGGPGPWAPPESATASDTRVYMHAQTGISVNARLQNANRRAHGHTAAVHACTKKVVLPKQSNTYTVSPSGLPILTRQT